MLVKFALMQGLDGAIISSLNLAKMIWNMKLTNVL